MKQFLVILIAITFSACSNTDIKKNIADTDITENHSKALEKSYKSWLDLKDQHGSNYSYERDGKISNDYFSSTKITVQNNQVEFRAFYEWQKGNTPSMTWVEPFSQLNYHNQGAAVKTIDELYQQCETEIINKSISEYAITLRLDRLNLIKQCSYTQLNCTTGCTRGIRLQGLRFFSYSLKLQP